MDIGFIGLGKMGFPMARRLIEAKHQLIVFDTRREAVDRLVAMGAQAASSPKEVADRVETVMASLPSLQASLEVATGTNGVIEGKRVKRFVDLSTVGSQMAVRIHDLLEQRDIVQIDSPVSGGVGGAEKGTLAVMVSGPKAHADAVRPALDIIGKVFFIGEKPGSGQTMKLANNFLSATAVVATSEAVVMGVKSGLGYRWKPPKLSGGSGKPSSRTRAPSPISPPRSSRSRKRLESSWGEQRAATRRSSARVLQFTGLPHILVSMTRNVRSPSTQSRKSRRRARGAKPGFWLLQDAKARLSELVRRVHSEGPQRVTVHGRDEVVVISAKEFRRLKGDLTGEALVAVMQASPQRDIDLEPKRAPMPVREVVF